MSRSGDNNYDLLKGMLSKTFENSLSYVIFY